jgi:hypothetical protein
MVLLWYSGVASGTIATHVTMSGEAKAYTQTHLLQVGL